MPGPHMTASELAEELGRSQSWVYHKWAYLCDDKAILMPKPVPGIGTLAWSRAQIYAWLDRDLSDKQRIAANAFRAAASAAAEATLVSNDEGEVEQSKQALNTKLGLS